MVITSVGQGYESTEGCYNYKTSTETIYRGQGQPMDIGKSNDNFKVSQIRYLLVVILELNSVSEVQYKGMMTNR